MAALLFKLNNVPDDEADEIRELLDAEGVDYYETSAGNWGLSFAAIWLKDESKLVESKAILDEYQQKRYDRVVEHRDQLRASGQDLTWWQGIKLHPIKFIAVTIFISVILYLSVAPFFAGSL